jgi:hypothetical protein
MTYINKGRNLTINRRVSLNFRDSALFQIFKQTLNFNKQFIEKIHNALQQQQEVNWILLECLKVNLQICHKCLIFDYTSILLNETLDEPSTTNVSTHPVLITCLDTQFMERVRRGQGDP